MPVAFLTHADRGDAETEEAGIEPSELGFDARIIQKIIVHDFAQLGVPLPGRAAPDREHAFHVSVEQAFAQDALPDHARCAEQDDFHPIFRSVVALRVQAAAAS